MAMRPKDGQGADGKTPASVAPSPAAAGGTPPRSRPPPVHTHITSPTSSSGLSGGLGIMLARQGSHGKIMPTGTGHSQPASPHSEAPMLLRWRRLPVPQWSGRCAAPAVVLEGGAVLLMGGFDGQRHLNEVWRSTDTGLTWQQQPIPQWTPRLRSAAAVLPGGQSGRSTVLLMGGEDERREVLRQVWLSEDAGQSWRSLPSPPWPARCGATALVLPNGKGVLLMGGWGESGHLQDVWQFSSASGHFEEDGEWTQLPPPAWSAREDASAFVLTDNVLLVLGGHGEDGLALRDSYISRNFGEKWEKLKNPSWPARGFAVGAMLPGGPLILGGSGENHEILQEAWDGNAHGSKWRHLPTPPWPARSGAAAVTLPSGSVLLIGGMGEHDRVLQDTWIFEKADGAQVTQSSGRKATQNKFKIAGSVNVDHAVTEQSLADGARRLAQEIMHAAASNLPESSPLCNQLRLKLEGPLSTDKQQESIVQHAVDNAALSVLTLDVKKTYSVEGKGAKSHRIHIKGHVHHIEAANKTAFQELLHLVNNNALSTILRSGEIAA